MIRHCLKLYRRPLAVGLVTAGAALHSHAAVYINGHPDDIELFMNAALDADLAAQRPTVLIVMTAGDAGAGTGAYTQKSAKYNQFGNSYSQVRLNAHEAAVRFMVGLHTTYLPPTQNTTETIEGYTLPVQIIGPVKLYNLLLPDGGQKGEGYEPTGTQSLQKLVQGQQSIIQALDPQQSRYTLESLEKVVRGIALRHFRQSNEVGLNLPETDQSLNPNDHADHQAASLIAQRALQSERACLAVNYYEQYAMTQKSINLTAEQEAVGYGTFGALNTVLVTQGNPNSFIPSHLAWIGKQYVRQVQPKQPCAWQAASQTAYRFPAPH